jgi:hypothetical protein
VVEKVSKESFKQALDYLSTIVMPKLMAEWVSGGQLDREKVKGAS